MPEVESSPRPRVRAKRACLHCNRRRVRCNVTETHPCHNCRSMNVPCDVGTSKRGKYPRKKGQHAGTPTSIQSPASTVQSVQRSGSQCSQILSGQQHDYTPTERLNSETAATRQHTVFLGESSPLTAVIDDGRRSPDKGYASEIQRTRLHYPIPERLDGTSSRDEALRVHKLKMEAQLHADGAFSSPPKETCELLLEAYFTWFHPCFPILNRAAVHQAYVQGTLSPLLLQAMLFIGVSLCTDIAFARTEYEMRYHAKFLFYSRARAIYDADWETNKILKLQSLFLLSFWRGGPSEERDTRFWLGVAISLAHKKGMHMMSKLSFQSAQEEKTWRRIWWALYIRDQQSAAALGLPPRIRDEDCDVAMLTAADVEDEQPAGDERVFGSQSTVHIHYPVEMAKLARLLRAIVSAQYLPTQSTADAPSRATLHQQLVEWESNLPNELRLGNNSTPSATFLVGLLHMTYNNLYILLYRSLFLHPRDGKMDEGHIALEAATKSTRIIDDLLSQNLVQHGPTHLITHAFSTLCIQTIHCRRTTGTTRKLAEHRARLCLLGLQELQKSWDLENWVLDLFFRCLDDSTARTLRLTDPPVVQIQGDAGERSHATERIPEVSTPKTPATRRDASGKKTDSSQQLSPLPTDMTPANEWYGLFNFTDDYADVVGASPSQADSLNLQNLEFLYRFL